MKRRPSTHDGQHLPLGDLPPDPLGEFPMPPSGYLAHLMFQLVQRRQDALDAALMGIGLSVSKWRVLYGVWRLLSCTMGDLSRVTGIDRTTLTRAVDRLVMDGLVARSDSPSDRRQMILCLTDEGAEAFRRALGVQGGMAEQMLQGIADGERREACRLLITLLHNALQDPALTQDVLDMRLNGRDVPADGPP